MTDKKNTSDRIKASPHARKLAAESNIELADIKGTGPGGRITARDVQKAAGESSSPEPSNQKKNDSNSHSESIINTRKNTPLEKLETDGHGPCFYTTTSVNMTASINFLTKYAQEKIQHAGVNILTLKAVAYALRKIPAANSVARNNHIHYPSDVNISIALGANSGTVRPVIIKADELSLEELIQKYRSVVERVKSGRSSIEDSTKSTFTLFNMGMFNIENITPVIAPGESAALAVSSIQKKPVVVEERIQIGDVMNITMAADIRIIDAVTATRFINQIKKGLECPALLFC